MVSKDEKQFATTGQEQVDSTPGNSSACSSFHHEEAAINPEAERKLLRKLDLCIFPTIFIIYMLSFLDRINISNARIQGMSEDLGLSGNRFNVALFVS